MTAMAQSHSVFWSALLHSTAGNIQLGYALTKSSDGRGFVVATTANLASSASGRVHGVPLTVASSTGSVQVQQDGIVDAAFLPFLGAGNSTDFANVDALGRVVRSTTQHPKLTLGLCGADGSMQFSRSVGIISGTATPAVAAESIAKGDVLCPANETGGSERVKVADAAALVSGIGIVGIALDDATAESSLPYAGVGTRIDDTVASLGAGDATWVVASNAGRPIRKDVPEPGDAVVGSVDQFGSIYILPKKLEASSVNVRYAPFGAVGDAAVTDDVQALLDAVAAAEFPSESIADGIGGTLCREIFVPKGGYKITKPIQLRRTGTLLKGAGRFVTKIIANTFVGPAIWCCSKTDEFPHVDSAFAGGNAAIIDGTQPISFAKVLRLRDYGAGFELSGKTNLRIEMIIAIQPDTTANGGTIIGSCGARCDGETWTTTFAGPSMAAAFEVTYGGSAHLTQNCIFFGLTTTTGQTQINTPAASLPADGLFHCIECNWDGATMRIFIDGVHLASGARSGAIVQQDFEQVPFGFGRNHGFGETQYFNPPKAYVASLKVSETVGPHNSASSYTPPGAAGPGSLPGSKYAVDSSTLWFCNFDDLDGPFVKGRCRGAVAESGTHTFYIPYDYGAFSPLDAGQVSDICIEDIGISSSYGPCISLNSCPRTKIKRVFAKNSKIGIRYGQNCYSSSLEDLIALGTNSARFGICFLSANLDVTITHAHCEGFRYGMLFHNATPYIDGNIYIVTCDNGIAISDTIRADLDGCINISDEGTPIGAKSCLIISRTSHVSVSGAILDMSNPVSTGPLVLIDTAPPAAYGRTTLSMEGCKFYAVHATAIFDFKALTAPGFVTVLGGTNGRVTGTNKPWFSASSPAGANLVLVPEDTMGDASVNLAGLTTHTLDRDNWLMRQVNFTGALSATCAVTVPARKTSPRWLYNGTSGGHNVTVIAAGGSAVITLTPGQRKVVASDGVDIFESTT